MSQSIEALEPLLEAGRLLSSQLELADLLKTVLSLASKVVDVETASLLLLDEKNQELYFDLAMGLDEKASGLRLKFGQGIAGAVAQERRPAIINDVRKDARWSSQMDARSGFMTRSILAVPLLFKGRLVGVLEAINKRGGPFGETDLRVFEAFASQAAVAIENARLYASLKEESFKLNVVFSEMTDAAVLCDEHGAVLLANASARRLMGVGEIPPTIGAALRDFTLVPPLSEILDADSGTREFMAQREDPKLLILGGTITRLGGASEGRAPASPGWLCLFRDETEQRQREKIKRTFLSLISHKLKTPLSAVIGFSGILESELRAGSGSPDMLKAARSVSSESRKLGGLVDKLLRYTTLEGTDGAPARRPCAVDDIAAAAVSGLTDWLAERNARVEVRAAAGLTVSGDAEQLSEALKGLIENAVKFDVKPAKTVLVSAESAGKSVLVRIADTGPGIPPEEQQKIFSLFHQVEVFFTGQVHGLGLGLPYARKVVEMHGGKLELMSRLGQGTTVTVTLPRQSP